MREIKFRCWNPKYKEFSTWGFMSDGHFKGIPTGSHMSIDDCREYSQAYTGLHDKNGKEIYEGDIMMYGKQPFWVSFMPRFGFIAQYRERVMNSGIDIAEHEVIGNIYEHPELIRS